MIVVVGAGLGGSLAARLLGLAGRHVVVLDQRGDPRDGASVAPASRAINLAISERARARLAGAGLGESLDRIAVPIAGRVVHARDGATTFQPYGDRRPGRAADRILVPDGPVWSARREDLAALLVEAAADLHGVTFRFGATVWDASADEGSAWVQAEAGERIAGDLVVGADGTRSRVRKAVGGPEPTPIDLAYQQLTIPAGAGGLALRPDAHHVWPRAGAILSALPAPDGSFVATLFLPHAGAAGFAARQADDGLEPLFAREFADAIPHLPRLGEELRAHPINPLVEVHAPPWRGGRIALAGDACHTFAPFLGQGANAAIEDAAVLAAAIGRRELDLDRALALYARRREPENAALAGLSRLTTPLVLWLGDLGGSPRRSSRGA